MSEILNNMPNPQHSETNTQNISNSNQNSNTANPSVNSRHLWKFIPSFVKFCLAYGMIPTSYRLAMTYEEQILWLCQFIEDTVIPAIENDSKAIEELQDYVDHLDVPQVVKDEIDQMIEDGDFEEIFDEYIQPKLDALQDQIDDINNTIGQLNLPTVIDPETRGACTSSYGRNT